MLWLLFLLMVGVLGTNSSNESNETNQSMSEFNCSSADFPPCHHCNSCEEAMECAPVACLAEGAPALLECMYSEERRWYLVCTSHISKGHAMVTGPILWCLAWWSSAWLGGIAREAVLPKPTDISLQLSQLLHCSLIHFPLDGPFHYGDYCNLVANCTTVRAVRYWCRPGLNHESSWNPIQDSRPALYT